MEEAPENGKESSHSAHGKRMNEETVIHFFLTTYWVSNTNNKAEHCVSAIHLPAL
jgi:hypothetical protein